MTKVAYNDCFGGFSLSRKAILLGREISKNQTWNGPCIIGDTFGCGSPVNSDYGHLNFNIPRTDETLISVIEKLGDEASGVGSRIKIVDLPKGTKYRIDEYDGYESVMTQSDYDWEVA